jgi:hypothetical protein
MKNISELPLYCKAGIYTAVAAVPIAIYSGIKLLCKIYKRKHKKVYIESPTLKEIEENKEEVEEEEKSKVN